MSKTSPFRKPLSALCALLFLGGAAACGAAVDPIRGSETHFLARCSAACGAGLECLDGLCTRSCVTDAECGSLSHSAACVSAIGGGSSCRVACSVDDECSSENSAWACSSSSCVGSPALLSSSDPAASAPCPTFAGGVQQPSVNTTSFEQVPAVNVQWAHADQNGVYWIDLDGGVYAWKRGDAGATTLRPAPSTPGTRLGLTGDATRLYWTEAGDYPPGPNEPGPPPAPGRLLAIAKDGGAPELLVESASNVLTPLGVDPGGRVFVQSSDGYLHEVSASGTLERVANVPALNGGDLQMVDGQVYWLRYDDAAQTAFVYGATPGSGEPVNLAPVEGGSYSSFVAGRGVVLWAPEETRFEPLLLVQHFRMLNENTGCVQDLPSVELSIGQTLIDDRHVYWHSFNALAAASPGLPEPSIDLLRVDLRSGRFEQVTTAGMPAVAGGDLLAQSGDTLYVRVNPGGSLFAVRKPE
jgi:hypothetical protein